MQIFLTVYWKDGDEPEVYAFKDKQDAIDNVLENVNLDASTDVTVSNNSSTYKDGEVVFAIQEEDEGYVVWVEAKELK